MNRDTRDDRVQELEETAAERWRYFVYRDIERVELTRDEYEARYRPDAEDQGN